mgnify:CR=1 FL=1|jgi:branched-chain amino acid transport system permease protein
MKNKKNFISLMIFSVLLILLPFIVPNNYYVQIINMSGIYAILAMGFNILAGYTGQISLGQAAFFAIGAYTSALMNTVFGLPFYITFPVSMIVSGVFGLILAIPALKVKGKYLVLLTIGFGEIVRLVLLNWKKVTGGASGILRIKAPELFGFSFNTLQKYYFLILIFCIILYFYQRKLINSRAGRALIAIREDEAAAELVGINLAQYKIKAFVISAVFCGIGGCLYAHMVKYVSPDTFRYDESVMILSMAVIGGLGTLNGPILGAIFLTILPEILRQVGDYRLVIYGIMLILVIMFYPGGLISSINKLIMRIEDSTGRRKRGAV